MRSHFQVNRNTPAVVLLLLLWTVACGGSGQSSRNTQFWPRPPVVAVVQVQPEALATVGHAGPGLGGWIGRSHRMVVVYQLPDLPVDATESNFELVRTHLIDTVAERDVVVDAFHGASPDGRWAVVSAEGKLRAVEEATGRITDIAKNPQHVGAVTFSPRGEVAVHFWSENRNFPLSDVLVYDLTTGRQWSTPVEESVLCQDFASNLQNAELEFAPVRDRVYLRCHKDGEGISYRPSATTYTVDRSDVKRGRKRGGYAATELRESASCVPFAVQVPPPADATAAAACQELCVVGPERRVLRCGGSTRLQAADGSALDLPGVAVIGVGSARDAHGKYWSPVAVERDGKRWLGRLCTDDGRVHHLFKVSGSPAWTVDATSPRLMEGEWATFTIGTERIALHLPTGHVTREPLAAHRLRVAHLESGRAMETLSYTVRNLARPWYYHGSAACTDLPSWTPRYTNGPTTGFGCALLPMTMQKRFERGPWRLVCATEGPSVAGLAQAATPASKECRRLGLCLPNKFCNLVAGQCATTEKPKEPTDLKPGQYWFVFDDFDNGGGINMRGGADYRDDNQDD